MSDVAGSGAGEGAGEPESEEGRARREGVAHRLAQQWAAMRRAERRAGPDEPPPPIVGGTSNFSRAEVPYGVDLAAAWSWRLLVIAAAAYLLGSLIAFFAVLVIPVIVALLLTALVIPIVDWLVRIGVRRSVASILVVILTFVGVGALLSFAGQQVAQGASDLADATVAGLVQIKDWLKDGPLNASEKQIDRYLERAQEGFANSFGDDGVLSRVTEVGTAVGHILAGFFIVLFSTFFFLSDGTRIWSWLVRLSPRAARERVDSSGRVAWISLTQFVRATVIVAAVDALFIAIGAAILGVPFALAIGVLVFLGAFVPIVGATVAGAVAVLVALVDQGPITALIMLGVVIGVQQLEGHVLQPFLMGRWVSVHPLGVIIAIAAGVLTAGVVGALVAVPLAAAVNAVVQHLASFTEVGDDPVEELAEDYEETGEFPQAPEEPSKTPDPDDGVVGG